MSMQWRPITYVMCFWLAVSWCMADSAQAAVSVREGKEFAWTENAGWVNFAPTHGGASLHQHGGSSFLSGFVWAENVGWIKLAFDTNGPFANTGANNWGVNVNAAGKCSGFAWSETAGWVAFATTQSQVTVDQATGEMDGYAWSENLGYIHFRNAAPAYGVAFVWPPSPSPSPDPDPAPDPTPTPDLPSVSTDPAANLTGTSVTVGGTVTSDGNSTVTARGICAGSGSDTSHCRTAQGGGLGSFTLHYGSLQSGTRYSYRAWAENSQGRAYGSVRSFVAGAPPPDVQTGGAAVVGTTSVIVTGNVSSDNGAEVTARGICGGLSSDTPFCRAADSDGTGAFNVSFTNLQPGTTYYYRAYATNAAGSSWGELATVTTAVENWVLLLQHTESGTYAYAYYAGEFTARYVLPELPATTQWLARCLADFDGDGNLDILYSHRENWASGIALMQGCSCRGYVNLEQGFGEYLPEACLDVDGDGSLDLLLRHPVSTQVLALLLSGSTVKGVEPLFVIGDPAWSIRGGGDLAGDGVQGLMARNTQTGANVLASLQAGALLPGSVRQYSTVPDQAYTIVGAVDVDRDGNLDAVWHNKDAGELYVEYLAGGARRRVARLTDLPLGWEVRGAAQLPAASAAAAVRP